MGNRLLKCEQASGHAAFVATMDRLSDPSVTMVRMIRRLEHAGNLGAALKDLLRAVDAGVGDVAGVGEGEGDVNAMKSAGLRENAEALNDALGLVIEQPTLGSTSTSTTSDANSGAGSRSGLRLQHLTELANREPQDTTAVLLRQRLIARTKEAYRCRGLLTRLRFAQFGERHAVTDLKLFLLAAMECVLVYEELESQLENLGEAEKQMVYGTAVSDQMTYYEVLGCN